MIVKFFRHGTGGGSAVFDYLLGKEEDRPDAEILRGDVAQQKLLIDSLEFKRQYTSGCLSFEEAPDHLTIKQKNEIMDGFEETITAGLEVDRVSFAWVEHRDKGRLELNFVIANVDLEHGRLFQPYIHSHDKTRINAWKDIQNIGYDLSDPNDPIRKRLMAQRDNLPRATKEAREAITEGLENLVAEGLITNRDEVIQTLQDAGFEIARETDKAISIKNPDPKAKRNIRLTGGLYERDFKFSPEVQETVERDSSAYRDDATGRLREATRVLYEELDRKRDYHQARHGEPKRQANQVKEHVRDAPSSDRHLTGQSHYQSPSPYDAKPRTTKSRDRADDELVFARVKPNDASSPRKRARLCVPPSMGSGHWLRDWRFSDDGIWRNNRNEIGIKDHAKTTHTASQPSHASERGYHSAAERDYRLPRAEYREIESIIDGIGRNARQGTQSVTEHVRGIRDFTEQAHERAASLVESSQAIYRRANDNRRTTEQTRNHTDTAHNSLERVSEYISTSRRVNERYERIRDDARRLDGTVKEFTERNKTGTEQIDERARDCREISQQMTQALEKQRPTRSYSGPSMGR